MRHQERVHPEGKEEPEIEKVTPLQDYTRRQGIEPAQGGRGGGAGGAENRRRGGGLKLGMKTGCGKRRERWIGTVECKRVKQWSNWDKKLLWRNWVKFF